jgi:hypothetical protein
VCAVKENSHRDVVHRRNNFIYRKRERVNKNEIQHLFQKMKEMRDERHSYESNKSEKQNIIYQDTTVP